MTTLLHRLRFGAIAAALVLAGCRVAAPAPTTPEVTASGSITMACTGVVQTYRLSFPNADPKRLDALGAAAKRVTQRRLNALQQPNAHLELRSPTLTACVPQAEAAADLAEQLQNSPFSFALMEQVAGSGGDIVTEQFGSFVKFGITEQQIEWVEPRASAEAGKGKAIIRFNRAGQQQLRQAYARLEGKMVGMFVRGVPMSLMTVKPGERPRSLTIDGITSAELAEIFADDVNVGTFVRFELVQP